jgi:hypothetical protein
MSALAHLRPAQRVTFKAWRTDNSIGGVQPGSHPIALDNPQTLAQAVEQAAPGVHKAQFMVLAQDAVTGAGTLHIYHVKQSSKGRDYRDASGRWRIDKPLFAELVAEFPVRDFAPAEVWRLTRETPDFSGIDRTLVEVR